MSSLNRHVKSDKVKWAITGIVLVVVLLAIVLIGLQVFGSGKQKPSEWFKPDSDETESSSVSRNAGVYHDSDFGEAEIDVLVHPIPIVSKFFNEEGIGGWSISANGAETDHVVIAFLKTYGLPFNSVTAYYDESCSVNLTYSYFIEEAGLSYNETYEYQIYHEASGEYLKSELLNGYVLVPEENKMTPEVKFEGTKLSVGMPYEYYYNNPGNGAAVSRRSLSLAVCPVEEDSGIPIIGLNSFFNEPNTIYYSDIQDLSESPFTLVTGENSKVIIELEKLPYIDSYIGACVIDIGCYATYSWYDCSVFANLPLNFYFDISKLSAPKNIRKEGTFLKWDEVENAEGYSVFDGPNNIGIVDKPEINLDTKYLEPGKHLFRIRALGNVGTALAALDTALMTPYNISSVISPCVALTYDIAGDTITKFVSLKSTLGDHLFEINIEGKEFVGWFYDPDFTSPVKAEEVIRKDLTIYAKLSDVPAEPGNQPTWWDQYKWYVLVPIFVFVALLIAGLVVGGVRKFKRK